MIDGLYQSVVDLHIKSVCCGDVKNETTMQELRDSGIGLLREFANDDDIQYMQIISTNIGMIRTYQKRFASKD